MRGQAGFFDVDERLKQLSAKGDNLERLSAVVDFEVFRPDLERAVPRADGSKGGRPAFDHVLMFKVLLLQAMHTLSDGLQVGCMTVRRPQFGDRARRIGACYTRHWRGQSLPAPSPYRWCGSAVPSDPSGRRTRVRLTNARLTSAHWLAGCAM